MSINKVVITGNLGADPEIRRTQSGMAVLNMRLAVNDRRKDPQTGEWGDYCNWVGVTVFGNRAESLANMLRKGSKVAVDGKLHYSEWDDRNGGGRRSKLDVTADDVELLTPKQQGQQTSQPLNQGGMYQASTSTSGPEISPDPIEAMYSTDEIPW